MIEEEFETQEPDIVLECGCEIYIKYLPEGGWVAEVTACTQCVERNK